MLSGRFAGSEEGTGAPASLRDGILHKKSPDLIGTFLFNYFLQSTEIIADFQNIYNGGIIIMQYI